MKKCVQGIRTDLSAFYELKTQLKDKKTVEDSILFNIKSQDNNYVFLKPLRQILFRMGGIHYEPNR